MKKDTNTRRTTVAVLVLVLAAIGLAIYVIRTIDLSPRTDLQAARWFVQASLDQVEGARAAFYPSFDIRGFIGYDALRETCSAGRAGRST